MKTFSIVGAGRLGTALGAALARRGWRAEAIVDRDARAARESRRIIGCGRASTSLAAAAKARGTVIVAVPDDAVGGVAAALARGAGSWAKRNVFHTSGLVPAGALGPLAERGARVASLHPVQSFPRKDVPPSIFEGITWGLEGDAAAFGEAKGIVRA
ncbi:MAG TPA: NAD(P)-binding domain-containing protein, partial [Acidobacteriota bacterium]|nr:NAD(P)-binding domain-containing protein [Acidobacteriota bacterium]